MRISAAPPPLKPATPKEWTVLYCMDGNNDLEPWVASNLLDLETVGSSKDVNLVAQFSRAPQRIVHPHESKRTHIDGDWVGSRRYLLEQHSDSPQKRTVQTPPLTDSSATPNHGDPRTLTEFLTWGMKNFPAKHYMVVISDHGEGFRGTGLDDFYKDQLDLPELKQALEQARANTGVTPDLITFDTCLMAHAETAYQIKDQARYMVASEELVGADGLPNVQLLEHLKANPQIDGRQLASDLVDLSKADTLARKRDGREEAAAQMSAFDLSKMDQVASATAGLGQALVNSGLRRKTLGAILHETKHFDGREKPMSDFRDIKHFCQNLESSPRVGEDLRGRAQALASAVDAACLNRHNEGQKMEKAQGMSIYLPLEPKVERYHYDKTDFNQATGWSGWLDKKLG